MGLHTGFSRINAVIRWIGIVSLGCAALTALTAVFSSSKNDALVGAGIFGVLGGLALLVAWIGSGFLGEASRRNSAPNQPDSATNPAERAGTEDEGLGIRWTTIAAAFVVGGIISQSANGAYDLGRFVGAALMFLLLCIAIGAAIQKGRPARERKIIGIGVAASFFACAVLWAGKMSLEATAKREEVLRDVQQLRGVVQDSQAFYANALTSPASLPSASPVQSPAPKQVAALSESAVLTEAMQFVTEQAKRNQQSASSYLASLNQLGMENWLSSQALTNSAYRKQQRNKLPLATKALDTYEAQIALGFKEMRDYGSRLAGINATGASFNSGMLKTMPESERLTKEILVAERLVLGSIGALYDFLDRPDVPSRVQDGRIVFERQEDLDSFNRLIGEIQTLSAKSERATREAQSMRERQINALAEAERKLSSQR